MAISFVAANTGTNNYGTSVVVTKPTGTLDDDVLIAVIGGTRSGAPSGWTLLGSAASGTTSLGTVYCYYKVANGEGSSYTFNLSSSFLSVGVIAAYRGCNTTTPVDTTHFDVSAVGASTNFNSASVTAAATQWGITFATGYEFGSSSTRTWTEGSGTERKDVSIANSGSPDNTNLELTDSNANLSAGAFTRTQTRSAAASGGVKGTVLLNAAITATNAPAGNAASTATAYGVDPGVGVHPGQAAGTATAYGPTLTETSHPSAGAATATATAYGPTLTLTSSPAAGAATATATASSPRAGVGAIAGAVSATATSNGPTIQLTDYQLVMVSTKAIVRATRW